MDAKDFSNKTIISGAIIGSATAAALAYFYYTSKSSRNESSHQLVPGLLNQGNTCYLNALLQGLSSCPSFVGWLKDLKIEEMNLENSFLDSLRAICIELNESEGGVLVANRIVSSLAAHGWSITVGVEHDLYELFNVFVTTWEDELKRSRPHVVNNSLQNCHDSSEDDNSQTQSSSNGSPIITRKLRTFQNCVTLSQKDSKLKSPCMGTTATEYRCCNNLCGYKTVKYESFTVLTLSIPNSLMGAPTSESALLRKYFGSEIIRDAICDKCKAEGRKQLGFLKKHGIVKLPQTLMIRIERVSMLPYGSMKLTDHVSFSECLTLQDVCFRKNTKIKQAAYEHSNMWQLPDGTSRVVGGAEVTKRRTAPVFQQPSTSNGYELANYALIDGGSFVAERKEAQKYEYQLRAVSEHRGGPSSGHFVTYRRAPAPNHHAWYCTNDASVSRVTYSQVASCQSYMLFYERVRPHRFYDR